MVYRIITYRLITARSHWTKNITWYNIRWRVFRHVKPLSFEGFYIEQLTKKENFEGNCVILRPVFHLRARCFDIPVSKIGVIYNIILQLISITRALYSDSHGINLQPNASWSVTRINYTLITGGYKSKDPTSLLFSCKQNLRISNRTRYIVRYTPSDLLSGHCFVQWGYAKINRWVIKDVINR